MSLDAMGEALLEYTTENGLPVSIQMIRKLLYTLNFARCFNLSQERFCRTYYPNTPGTILPVTPDDGC